MGFLNIILNRRYLPGGSLMDLRKLDSYVDVGQALGTRYSYRYNPKTKKWTYNVDGGKYYDDIDEPNIPKLNNYLNLHYLDLGNGVYGYRNTYQGLSSRAKRIKTLGGTYRISLDGGKTWKDEKDVFNSQNYTLTNGSDSKIGWHDGNGTFFDRNFNKIDTNVYKYKPINSTLTPFTSSNSLKTPRTSYSTPKYTWDNSLGDVQKFQQWYNDNREANNWSASLGNFGVNGDGVDGQYGGATAAALKQNGVREAWLQHLTDLKNQLDWQNARNNWLNQRGYNPGASEWKDADWLTGIQNPTSFNNANYNFNTNYSTSRKSRWDVAKDNNWNKLQTYDYMWNNLLNSMGNLQNFFDSSGKWNRLMLYDAAKQQGWTDRMFNKYLSNADRTKEINNLYTLNFDSNGQRKLESTDAYKLKELANDLFGKSYDNYQLRLNLKNNLQFEPKDLSEIENPVLKNQLGGKMKLIPKHKTGNKITFGVLYMKEGSAKPKNPKFTIKTASNGKMYATEDGKTYVLVDPKTKQQIGNRSYTFNDKTNRVLIINNTPKGTTKKGESLEQEVSRNATDRFNSKPQVLKADNVKDGKFAKERAAEEANWKGMSLGQALKKAKSMGRQWIGYLGKVYRIDDSVKGKKDNGDKANLTTWYGSNLGWTDLLKGSKNGRALANYRLDEKNTTESVNELVLPVPAEKAIDNTTANRNADKNAGWNGWDFATTVSGIRPAFGLVGEAISLIPGGSNVLQALRPSSYIGTVGSAINGSFVAPWNTENKGWGEFTPKDSRYNGHNTESLNEMTDVFAPLFAKGVNATASKVKSLASPTLEYLSNPAKYNASRVTVGSPEYTNWGGEFEGYPNIPERVSVKQGSPATISVITPDVVSETIPTTKVVANTPETIPVLVTVPKTVGLQAYTNVVSSGITRNNPSFRRHFNVERLKLSLPKQPILVGKSNVSAYIDRIGRLSGTQTAPGMNVWYPDIQMGSLEAPMSYITPLKKGGKI